MTSNNGMDRFDAAVAAMIKEQNRQEIEKAIDNAKRSNRDKWWRKQFYRETARIAKQLGHKKRQWHRVTALREDTFSKRFRHRKYPSGARWARRWKNG